MLIPIDDLSRTLKEAASEYNTLTEEIADVRRLIVRFGEQLQALLDKLPQEHLDALQLRVRVILRGPPLIENAKVAIEALPSVPEGDHDVRPGATALYLEALGEGSDRAVVEIRSNPGQIVHALCSLDRYDRWLDPMQGLREADDDRVLLIALRPNEAPRPGPDASSILAGFLRELRIDLQFRSHFNRRERGASRIRDDE